MCLFCLRSRVYYSNRHMFVGHCIVSVCSSHSSLKLISFFFFLSSRTILFKLEWTMRGKVSCSAAGKSSLKNRKRERQAFWSWVQESRRVPCWRSVCSCLGNGGSSETVGKSRGSGQLHYILVDIQTRNRKGNRKATRYYLELRKADRVSNELL